MAHTDSPEVPELAPVAAKPRVVREQREIVAFDDDPRDAPSLELAVVPQRPHATGVRSRPCPVCETELARDVLRCPECGEPMPECPLVMPHSYALAYEPPSPRSPFFEEVASVLPTSFAKRLFVYPLLLAFFANLLVPCRFHGTFACLALSLVGLLGLFAHHRTKPLA